MIANGSVSSMERNNTTDNNKAEMDRDPAAPAAAAAAAASSLRFHPSTRYSEKDERRGSENKSSNSNNNNNGVQRPPSTKRRRQSSSNFRRKGTATNMTSYRRWSSRLDLFPTCTCLQICYNHAPSYKEGKKIGTRIMGSFSSFSFLGRCPAASNLILNFPIQSCLNRN